MKKDFSNIDPRELFLSQPEKKETAPRARVVRAKQLTPEAEKLPPARVVRVEQLAKKRAAKLVKKRENKSEKINLLVKPSTKAALVALAEENGESLNSMTNIILEAFLQGE